MKVKSVRSKALIVGSEDELNRIKNKLIFTVPSFSEKFNNEKKIICLADETKEGLLIPRALVKRPVEEADWERVEIPFNFTLQDYQKEAVEEFIKQGGNGVIIGRMGSGKTVVALYLAHLFGLKTLVVVHTEALFLQWIEKVKEICGITPSIIRGDVCDISSPITIGMLKTLAIGKRIDREKIKKAFGFTIYDEVHRCPTYKFNVVVGMFWDKYRLGLSGTYKRNDNLHQIVSAHLGKIVYMRSERMNVKVKTFIYVDNRCSTDKCYINNEFFLPYYLNKISLIDERNYFISLLAYSAYRNSRCVMIISDRLRILKEVEKYLKRFGVKKIGWITGNRKEFGELFLATFGSGSEGIDIPELDCLIFATPRTSIKQAVGRLLRKKNIVPLVIDIVDHNAIMKKFYYARKKIYKKFRMPIEERFISVYDIKKLKGGVR